MLQALSLQQSDFTEIECNDTHSTDSTFVDAIRQDSQHNHSCLNRSTKLKIRGISYKSGMILLYNINCNYEMFGRIQLIFYGEDISNVQFLIQKLIVTDNERGYHVLEETEEYMSISYESLALKQPLVLYNTAKFSFVALKYQPLRLQ